MNKRVIRKRIEWFFRLFIPNKVVKADISYLSPNNRLLGKKIIITGGNKGIGYAMARKFVAEGASVLICGRDEDSLKIVGRELSCPYLVLDVLNTEEFPEFINKADKILGGANVLVNNAGISLHEGDISHVSEQGFDNQINTNLKGCYFLSKAFLADFEKRKSGGILFVSSERGRYVDDIPYGLTKAAINSLVQGLAFTNSSKHIKINAVAPGVTATKLTGRSEDNLYSSKGIGRIYLSDEVAEVACFLISDVSNCISGQIIYCDNGNSVNSYKR